MLAVIEGVRHQFINLDAVLRIGQPSITEHVVTAAGNGNVAERFQPFRQCGVKTRILSSFFPCRWGQPGNQSS